MGHPNWSLEFGVSLLRPGRWYIPSLQWYDGPCSFWRNTDLNGDFSSTIPANPLCSFRVPHSLLYYVCNATKLAPVWSCPDTLAGQQKTILQGFPLSLDTSPTQRILWFLLYLTLCCGFFAVIEPLDWGLDFTVIIIFVIVIFFGIGLYLQFLMPQPLLPYFSHFWLVSPMEHKRDATVAGLSWPSNPTRGLAPTNPVQVSDAQTSALCHSGPPDTTTSPTSAPLVNDSTAPDSGTTAHSDTYSGPAPPGVPFPTESSSTHNYLHRAQFSSRVVHQIPIQGHYPLQQHQGAIHWRNPLVRAFPMSWPWTLFLWSFGQLGVVPAYSGLLATSFWDPPCTRTPSFSQCAHWDDISCRWTEPDHPDPWISQRSIWYLEGCYGIWGIRSDLAMVEHMSFHDAMEVLLQAPNSSSDWSDRPFVH